MLVFQGAEGFADAVQQPTVKKSYSMSQILLQSGIPHAKVAEFSQRYEGLGKMQEAEASAKLRGLLRDIIEAYALANSSAGFKSGGAVPITKGQIANFVNSLGAEEKAAWLEAEGKEGTLAHALRNRGDKYELSPREMGMFFGIQLGMAAAAKLSEGSRHGLNRNLILSDSTQKMRSALENALRSSVDFAREKLGEAVRNSAASGERQRTFFDRFFDSMPPDMSASQSYSENLEKAEKESGQRKA